MAERVVKDNEISLNGVFYPVASPPKAHVVSVFPQKVTIGDQSKDTEQIASSMIFSDARGGIGIDVMDPSRDTDRAWWSTANLRQKGHLTLPSLATETTAPVTDERVLVIGDLGGAIYAVWGGNVYKWNDSGATWGSSVQTLTHKPSDLLTARLNAPNGGETLLIATTFEIDYSTDGASWDRDNTNARYLALWDDRLWAIDEDGQLRYLPPGIALGGTWTTDAQLPVPNKFVTNLFVGQDTSGEPILYAMTRVGLYAHDAANVRWVETQFTIPFHERAGKGSTKWRDGIYSSVGSSIYRYQVGSGGATISPVGADRDDGLPADRRGDVIQLVGSHNDLLALVDAAAANPNRLQLSDMDLSGWTAGSGFTVAADISDRKEGVASSVTTPSSGASTGDVAAYHNIEVRDLSDFGYLSFWAKAVGNDLDYDPGAGDAARYQILLDNNANAASPVAKMDVPALASDTWKECSVALTSVSSLTDVISVGLEMNVDIGTIAIKLDDIRAYRYVHVGGSAPSFSSTVHDVDGGTGEILQWNQLGWQVLWDGNAMSSPLEYALVSSAYNQYRLWWSWGDTIYYTELVEDLINPNQVPSYSYATDATHLTPWFDGGWENLDKLALAVRAKASHATSTEIVTIYYATDYQDNWASLGTISSDTEVDYLFPNSTTPSGTSFKAIRFKVELRRGGTVTLTPDLTYLSLSYMKVLPPKWGWTVELSILEDHNENTVKQMQAALRTAAETTGLLEFTFRDDSTDNRNYYVKIAGLQGYERTGYDERGIMRLTLVEP